MKKLQILKAILDFFWFFSLIGGIGILLFTAFYLFNSAIDIPVIIKGQEMVPNNLLSKLIIFVNAFTGLLFLFSIYLLRKVVDHFQKRDIFNPDVIKHFNLIGKLIISSSLLSNLSLFIYNMVNQDHIELSLGFGSYDSFLISISLGLFFMVISEIFKIAASLKEENELTV
jgi:EamA domain-containing membrane protein RarD